MGDIEIDMRNSYVQIQSSRLQKILSEIMKKVQGGYVDEDYEEYYWGDTAGNYEEYIRGYIMSNVDGYHIVWEHLSYKTVHTILCRISEYNTFTRQQELPVRQAT